MSKTLILIITSIFIINIFTYADTFPIAIYTPNFNSQFQSDWTLNGNSLILNNNILQLTQAISDQSGTAFYTKKICNSNDFKFSVFFSFEINSPTSIPADGLCFIIQQYSKSYGGAGGGIGYGSMPGKSIAVEYDTYYNPNLNDIDNNHIALDINGSVNHQKNASFTGCSNLVASSSDLSGIGISSLADSKMKYSWIDYDGNNIEVRINNTMNRPTNPILNIKYNLAAYFDGASVFYGFGGATGSSYEQNLVYSAYVNNRYTPIDVINQSYVQSTASNSTTNISICKDESYSFNSTNYTLAGTYAAHLTNAQGCDSTATLVLSVKEPTSSTTKAFICQGNSYSFNGMRYTTSGTYSVHFTNAEGCDSTATLILSAKEPTSSTTVTICDGDSYSFNGHSYSTVGTYSDSFTLVSGCDSVATLNLSVSPKNTLSQDIYLLDGETYTINGHVYYKAGTYTDVLKDTNGCDSTVTTSITIIDVPNTFSPNGDGVNDIFMKGWHVKIYNRNGILMYEGIDGWNGTQKGNKAERDTYFFVLYMSGSTKTKTGYITLVR